MNRGLLIFIGMLTSLPYRQLMNIASWESRRDFTSLPYRQLMNEVSFAFKRS